MNLDVATKTFILLCATIFICIGKIDQTTWMQTVLVIAGIHATSDYMNKKSKGDKDDGSR